MSVRSLCTALTAAVLLLSAFPASAVEVVVHTPAPTAAPEETAAPSSESTAAADESAAVVVAAVTDPGFVPTEVTLKKFTASTDAVYLDLGDMNVGIDALIEYLSQFPYLQKVDMFGTPVYGSDIRKLEAAFPNVKFGWTIRISEHTIRTDAKVFSTLHTGRSQRHYDNEFWVLKYCTELVALDIGHNGVKDLSFLYNMPNLKVLILACNSIEDLTPIASLHQLEYLELFTNLITDISPLSGLTRLMDLNLSYNYIQDYSPLYSMTWLKRLWFFNSNSYAKKDPVPNSVVTELQAHLPNTQMDWKNEPTNGGWRVHPHYDVIYRIFNYGTYEPFEDSVDTD